MSKTVVDLYEVLKEPGVGIIPNTTILAGSETSAGYRVLRGIVDSIMNACDLQKPGVRELKNTRILTSQNLILSFNSDLGEVKLNSLEAKGLLPHLIVSTWTVTQLPPAATFTLPVLESDFQYNAIYEWIEQWSEALEYAEADPNLTVESFMSYDEFNLSKHHVWGSVSLDYESWVLTLPGDQQAFYGSQKEAVAREAQVILARQAKKVVEIENTPLILDLVKWYQFRIAAYLVGDSGGGKTTVIQKVAYILGLPFYLQVFDKYMDPDRILGTWVPNGDGTFRFELSPFMKAFKYGGLYLADEINMTTGDVTSLFHSVLDGQDIVTIPATGEVVERHPLFRMAGAVNESYAGTKPLNKAFLSRFGRRDRVEAMTEEMLIRLAAKEFAKDFGKGKKLNDKIIRSMVTVVKKIETKYKQEQIDGVINYRHLQSWISLFLINGDFKESARSTVVNLSCELHEVNKQVYDNIILANAL